SKLPEMCDCPLCQALYEKTYGQKLPDLSAGAFPPSQDAAYLRYLQQRYDSTTNWIARGVAAIRQVNPAVRTDSLICVSPICSDQWWGTGVAWDRLNETGLDMPTTDPYILLHNYVGDSTHWYVTETAAHLTAATPKRQCGIVLEGSRLRAADRELDPVEVYGSALSAVCHGARELAWWHYDHLTDASKTTDRSAVSRACVRGVYGLLKQADPWLGHLQPVKRVAYLHSRAADDLWRFYTRPTPSALLTHAVEDPRYAAVAQHEVLYYLFRRGVPTDLYYLESVQEAQLADYPVIVVPFAFAIADRQAEVLNQLAQQGKTVVVISECGSLDQMGMPRTKPALLDLCGLQAPPSGETKGTLVTTQPWLPSTGAETFKVYEKVVPGADARVCATVAGKPAILQHKIGKGEVLYLAGAFGYDLVANRDNEKRTRTERIVPNPPAQGQVAVLDAVLHQGCGQAPGVLAALQPGKDIEATCLTNDRGELVLLVINWENEAVETELRVTGSGELQGYRLQPDGTLADAVLKVTDGAARVVLGPQEAGLWHLVR
ncbi:beta-galactosidase trimerization domain-containing protein, partial [bacterium]|nr:beta-galactosidase trimerization domain-containing protein [bacterium]